MGLPGGARGACGDRPHMDCISSPRPVHPEIRKTPENPHFCWALGGHRTPGVGLEPTTL